MVLISILASPPSVFSVRPNVRVLNRMAICVAIAGVLIVGPRLLSARRMDDEGALPRAAQERIAAPGLHNARPIPRLAIGLSATAWSGAL